MKEFIILLGVLSLGLNVVLGFIVYSRNQIIFELQLARKNINNFANNSFDHLCKAINEAESLRKMNSELSSKNHDIDTENKKLLLTIRGHIAYIEASEQKIKNLEEMAAKNMNSMDQIDEDNKFCYKEIDKLNKKIERILDTLTDNPLVNMGSLQCGYLLDLIKEHNKNKKDKQNALQKTSEVRMIRAHVGGGES